MSRKHHQPDRSHFVRPNLLTLEGRLTTVSVVSVAPALDAGYISAGLTAFQIGFSEPVLGGGNAANYSLAGTGPDRLLGTADDTIIPLSVASASNATALSFAPLTEDVYRLTVRDAITDLAGNRLDGNGDGVPGGNFVRDFVVTAGPVVGLTSPGGIAIDVQASGRGAGQLLQSTGNAFDGAGRLQVAGTDFAPPVAAPATTDGGRTVVSPPQTINGLTVARRVTVPATGSQTFSRTVDAFTNPTAAKITTTVRIVGNLGSDAATTVFATSNGDNFATPSDAWIGTDDADGTGSPAVINSIRGPFGLQPDAVAVTGDNIAWRYSIAVNPGETVRLAHFTILGTTRAAAVAALNALIQPDRFGGEAASFLTSSELRSLANFQFLPTVQSIAVNGPGGTQQRSMVSSLTVTFNTVVDLDAGAFTVLPQRGGTVAVTPAKDDSSGRSIVTLTFAGDAVETGTLMDGNYALKVLGSRVRHRLYGTNLDGDGDGQAGGNYRFTFDRLFGDGDGNRVVDTLDYLPMLAAFGAIAPDPRYLPQFDADRDGDIDGQDMQRFWANYNFKLFDYPPPATSLSWFTWYDQLRQQRLDAVPNARKATFYFAQSGSDETGDGSQARPWKSLAKASEVLAAVSVNVRLRFRRGDVFRETTWLNIAASQVTIDDYGDGAKPLFTRFTQQYANGWQQVSGTLYRRPEPMTIGWVRPAADPFGTILQRTDSSVTCATTTNSWYYDATAQMLYVNLGSNPNLLAGGLEACPGDGKGWFISGDNVRLQNLRLEGVGMSRAGTGYGIQILQQTGFQQSVLVGVEALFTGYHAIGQTNRQGGLATFVDCVGGYLNDRQGETVFVSYADRGGNQAIWHNSEARFGKLPSEGQSQGTWGIYTHTADDSVYAPGLVIAYGLRNPTMMPGAVLSGPPADTLGEVQSFVVGAQGGYDYVGWGWTAYMNDTYDFANAAYRPNQSLFPLASAGWVINSTITFDAINQPTVFGLFHPFDWPYQIAIKFINCQFDVTNAVNWQTTVLYPLDSVATAANILLQNSIVSIVGTSARSLNLPNSPVNLRNNAYLLSSNADFSQDSGGVDLRPLGRIVPGTVPSPSSPLYDGGTTSPYVLDYDRFLRPRGKLRTIGPVTGG